MMSPGLGPWRRTTASYCSVLSLKIPAMAMRLERLAAFFPSRAASTLPSSPSKYRIALSNRLTSVRVTRVVHLPENRTWIYKLIYFLVRTFTPRTRQRRRKHWPAGISASEPPGSGTHRAARFSGHFQRELRFRGSGGLASENFWSSFSFAGRRRDKRKDEPAGI